MNCVEFTEVSLPQELFSRLYTQLLLEDEEEVVGEDVRFFCLQEPANNNLKLVFLCIYMFQHDPEREFFTDVEI